jgi:hypothetical protein
MANLLKNAIHDVREYYIRKLLDSGFVTNIELLSSYTFSELKKEYTTLISKERK